MGRRPDVRGGHPRRSPAIRSPAHDRSRHHLRRLHTAPERAGQHARTPRRGPPALCGLGTARRGKIDDRPAGRGRREPPVCRRPRAASRPRGPARHPLARQRRPHPLGAAGFPAAVGRPRPLAHQPRGAAVRGPDGAGGLVSADIPHIPSKFVEIVPLSHRQGNCIPYAAIRWHDFGNRPALGRPLGHFSRHPDTPLLSLSPRRRFPRPTPERVFVADHQSSSGFSGTGPSAPPPQPIGT